jgi:hypothetical protein
MNLRNFFAELRRRNVYKVAVVYAIVGWLVMQIAATAVPALHLSDVTSALVLFVILGFPTDANSTSIFARTWARIRKNLPPLRHPTLQRIFGRAEKARGSWTFAETPLNAISRSQREPRVSRSEIACCKKSRSKGGSRFYVELDCSQQSNLNKQ